MKFTFLHSLSATILTGLFANMVLGTIFNDAKKPENAGNKIPYIITKIDTVNIPGNPFKTPPSFTAGVFMPTSHKIKINYFTTSSTDPRVKRFCTQNNAQMRLILRHEKEHARKANLTKNTWFYAPITRGAVAVQNEIVAPAAEIIEALDARYETGKPFPTNRSFIALADKRIVQYATEHNLEWPLDFNNQKIADIIIECATERFTKELKRGMYKQTILSAIKECHVPINYITNNMCDKNNHFMFNPSINAWGPMWQFDSKRCPVNIWNAASQQQKNKLITTVDSIVLSIAGQNKIFLNNTKTH